MEVLGAAPAFAGCDRETLRRIVDLGTEVGRGPGAVLERAGRLLRQASVVQARLSQFFGTRDGGTYACDPAQVQHAEGDLAGASTAVECGDGKGSWAHLVRTTLGTGEVVVDGVAVAVVRLQVDGTLSGRVRGTSTDLLTVVAATGLPVVWERTVDSVADAFGSSVRYREHARFDLAPLTPQT